eukprot:gb/GFBE01045211.1/.p1 GENE.gb/GFBE01045211.1/~~gb/GFBE01045211.1/.p1  ORF type:complete len:167 (+),score=24.12 gb/GFBE01045211.1/:1-501(+)
MEPPIPHPTLRTAMAGPGDAAKAAESNKSPKEEVAQRFRDKYSDVLHSRQVRLYEAAWDECIRRELAAARTVVHFCVRYNTSFGQELHVIGSSPELGSWDLAQKVHMCWTEGNVWVARVDFSSGPRAVHYKYVATTDDITLWESGLNHHLEVGSGSVKQSDQWGGG